ncbi:MAG: hypothetical protein NUV64_00635 [Parcubacteria group bacterium]|nr:hypothetical protein [Parcubacteria group bacterium]MCR4342616.1 hypothetical protein [Patescibacteria group bacterium]
MFENQFEKTVVDKAGKEENIQEVFSEKSVDESIKENPKGFLNWFSSFKDSIGSWPEKFFKDKSLRSSILYASITACILQAGTVNASENEIDKVALGANNTTAVSEIIESESSESPKRIRVEDLASIQDREDREAVAERVNFELETFDRLSSDFNSYLNDKIKGSPDLFPDEIIKKVAGGEKVFDIAGRMEAKIIEANDNYLEYKNGNFDIEGYFDRTKKIFDNGKISFSELAKVLPEVVLAQKMSVLVHEIGHENEALRQGADTATTTLNLFGGYTEWSGDVKNTAAINVSGMNADKRYGEFLVNTMREGDSPGQFMAIMALVAKSEAMNYALSTYLTSAMQEHKGNDIIGYAKNTGASVEELALGLTADFIMDSDNWRLMGTALGMDGIKFPQTTFSPMYELGERGPIIGIKFKGTW